MTQYLRTSSVVVLCLSLAGAGCAQLTENRSISELMESLEKNNESQLRAATSSDFEQKALQGKQSVTTMKLFDVPTGKMKVIKTVDEDENTKRVTVEVGETKSRVVYRLKREKNSGWVVDDLYLNKRDLQNGQSVGAKLNLMISLQEFLDAWSNADAKSGPSAVAKCTTTEFQTALQDLPPAELSRMTNRLTGELGAKESLRPRLTLREETAECKFTRKNAEVTVKFERQGNSDESVSKAMTPVKTARWLVTDVSIDSSKPGEDIASVKHMARVAAAAIAFHNAYTSNSKDALLKVCTKRFFEGSLSGADLSLVTLPPLDSKQTAPVETADATKPKSRGQASASSSAGDIGPEISVEAGTASYLWKTDKEIIRIGLVKDEKHTTLPVYHVDDVTIYELNGRQNKRLSSLFTSQVVMQIFREALLERDIQQLQLNSTHDFRTRVWDRLSPELAKIMPLDALPRGNEQILNMVFEGPLTSITLTVGERAVTIILRDEQGKVLVDDVQLARPGFPDSLKTTCEALIPVYQFSHMMMNSQIVKMRGVSSHEFNRMVWNQLPEMPATQFDLPKHFGATLSKVHVNSDTAIVTLGDQRFGAKFLMVKEKDTFQIDDVVFVTGPETAQASGLRQLLRSGIQSGALSTTMSGPVE